MSAPKACYPTKARIESAVAAAKACGLDVCGIEVSRDGSIRILESRAVPNHPANDFERFEDRL